MEYYLTPLQSIGLHFALLIGIVIAGRFLAQKVYTQYQFDPMRSRFPAFYFGLAWTFGLLIFVFNITTSATVETYEMEEVPVEMIEMTLTNKKVKTLSTQKKVKIIPPKIDSIILVEEDQIDTIVQKIEKVIVSDAAVTDTFVATPLIVETVAPPPPPLPPPPPVVDDTPFVIVEEMPRFPGCEETGLPRREMTDCANKALMAYVLSKVKYPSIARENGIEGYVVAQFVIDQEGNITDIAIKRDIGGGCGEAVANVLNTMKAKKGKWRPGRQQGRPVKVLFTLPIKFALN